MGWMLLSGVFAVGYLLITLEYYIKVNKTAIALLTGAISWLIYFSTTGESGLAAATHLEIQIAKAAQIIFFLLGAMTLVEIIDSHKGFKILTDLIHTVSKRRMLWTVSLFTFFLSSVLDNLTTTILMIALLRKMIPRVEERMPALWMSVIAANSGGAWTPIGDITTSMLWIDGQVSSWPIMKAIFLPSLVSMLVPLLIFSRREKGRFTALVDKRREAKTEPGARLVFYCGLLGLIFVPIFHAWTELPPFIGMFVSLAILWLITDLLHYKFEERTHLRLPYILTKIDTSSLLFFFGVLLTMECLETAGILKEVAHYLISIIQNEALLATLIGFASSILDNIPLVAATMGMFPLADYPTDSSIWHMIAYAAGVGGSLLLIGSASGIALMGLERVSFFSYFKKATLPVLFGYLAGMGVYLILRG